MTVRSMTGYATTSTETAAGLLTIELKSVNSRFLDLQFRMGDDLRVFEPALRELVMQQVTRGKVECRLSLLREKQSNYSYALNRDLLDELKRLESEVKTVFSDAEPLTVNELLRWPGVMEEAGADHDTLQEQVLAAMSSTVQAFAGTRDREGGALTDTLLEKVKQMEVIVAGLTPLMPQILLQFQQKATERMQEALGLATHVQGNPVVTEQDAYERIRQEVLLYGTKIDVSEELSRLAIHLQETRNVLKKGGPVGKRLDFMLQELNREANTLGSKAASRELSDASIELKLLIEQIREQVQNLE